MTASLALAARGFRVVLLEKAEKLEETGAGLQLSPNATRVLIALGLEGPARQPRRGAGVHQHHERAGRRRDHPPAAWRGRHAARRRALLGGASRRSAGGAAGRGQRQSRRGFAARLPVRGCGRACQGTDRGPAPRQFAILRSRPGADRRRRHLVERAPSSVSGRGAAILRHDRLARHARCDPAAARIHRAKGAALDGARRASRRLSDLGRAADQCGGDRAGDLEQAGLERARRRARAEGDLRRLALAGTGANDAGGRRRLAQMGAVHGARKRTDGTRAR